MKIQFIDDVRGALKLLSVNVAAIWAAIVGIIAADPMLFVTAWNAIPSELRWEDVSWIGAVAVLLSFLATIYPSWSASRVKPAEALRYE